MFGRFKCVLAQVNDRLEKLQIGLAAILLIGFIVTVFLEVTSRFSQGQSFIWSQDLATIFFLWSVFIAAPVAFRRDEHLQISLFAFRSGSPLQITHNMVIIAINCVFAAAYLVYGWKTLTAGFGRTTAATKWPMEIGWSAIFVMGASSVLYIIELLLADVGAEPDATSGMGD